MASQGRKGPSRYRRVWVRAGRGGHVVLYNMKRLIVFSYYGNGFLAQCEVVKHSITDDRDLAYAVRGWPTRMSEKMKRKNIVPKPADRHGSIEGCDNAPTWADWMTAAAWDDGSPRQAPSTTFFCLNGQWRCCLRDKAEGLVLWLSGDTFGELCALMEHMVNDAMAPWRKDEYDGGDGKRVKRSKT